MSQELAILARLKKGPLTPLEALREIGTLRLGARIYDLREKGHIIKTEMIPVSQGKRVARYTLVQKRVKK